MLVMNKGPNGSKQPIRTVGGVASASTSIARANSASAASSPLRAGSVRRAPTASADSGWNGTMSIIRFP
jgi:hypothetical protein